MNFNHFSKLFAKMQEKMQMQQSIAEKKTFIQLSSEEEEKIKRSLPGEVQPEELQRDVSNMLNQMSEEEIADARKELLSSLDPSLIAFLQKRGQYKDSLKGKTESIPQRELSNNSVKNPSLENDQMKAREIANAIDYSTIQTEEDLAKAVSLLPSSEQQKLAWTKPIKESQESSSIRYHFDGFIIPSSSSNYS